MSIQISNNTETPSQAEAQSAAAFDIEALSPRQQRVVLVCDVVESVRWMEHDEDNAITRWSQFATAVRSRIAPANGGEVIKSTGDGLMMQFQAAPSAVAAANAMQKIASEGNQGYTPERQMHLCIGIHQTQARRDAHDLYGHGVNLAARITTLAGPGEIIVTPEVRDHLTDSLDGEIEDMGECYLKHLSEPQRVYRISSNEDLERPMQIQSDETLSASIAVMPLDQKLFDRSNSCVGDLIADGVISQLTRSNQLRVISRLSTIALQGRNLEPQMIGELLGCRYVLSGSFAVLSGKLTAVLELSTTLDGRVFWSERYTNSLEDLFDPQSEVISAITQSVHAQILLMEFQAMTSKPMPNADSYSLLISAITLMHRMSRKDFAWANKILSELIRRHPRNSTPRAWMAKWHSLAIAQNWTDNVAKESSQAHASVDFALSLNSKDALALTVRALILGYVDKQFDAAKETYNEALRMNPNEPLAWIGTATLLSWQGEGLAAENAAYRAISLSPMDPMKYYFYSLASAATLVNKNFKKTLEFTREASRLNAGLSATLKIQAIAQVLNGEGHSAADTAHRLLKIEPGFSISSFQEKSPLFRSPLGQEFSKALATAGIPII